MSPLFPESQPDIEVPNGAFIGSVKLEGTIVLETAIDNSYVVDQEALLSAWEVLSPVSVESALVGRPDVVDFANNHCLLFAAVRTPAKVLLPASVELAKLGLPDHAAVTWTDAPILPSEPAAIYESVNAYYEQTHPKPRSPFSDTDANGQDSPSSSSEVPITVRKTHAVYEWKTIGIVYVTMSSIPHEVHIGVGLLPAFRGQGAGMKACAFAVQWAVETIRAHRVQARIVASPDRSRAQRLFAALGFAHEGIQRRAVPDAAGAWVDVTHMGIVDVDWITRRRLRAAPRSMWDEMFARHQREREELLQWEEGHDRVGLRRTSSMETVRHGSSDPGLLVPEALSEDDSRSPSPAPSTSSTSSYSSLPPKRENSEIRLRTSRASAPKSEGSDAEDPFSDSDWVLSGARSDSSRHPSEEPISRPLSAASWSSFESIGSAVSSASSTRGIAQECSRMEL